MKKKIIIVSVVLLAIVLSGFYLHFENTALETTEYTVFNQKLPEKFDGLKICHISDFHNTHSKKLRERLVSDIKAQSPDIIAVTGDLIDAGNTDVGLAVSFVEQIMGIAPVYYVTGNHEAATAEYNVLAEKLGEIGVKVLDNKTEMLESGESVINIIGINDPDFADEAGADDSEILNKEIEYAAFDSGNFSILLSHRPEFPEVYAGAGVDLVLSGHAHGGQFRLPFIGGVAAPGQGLFPKYISGVHTEGETSIVISRGIGSSMIPFRINNRPELVVVKLVNK